MTSLELDTETILRKSREGIWKIRSTDTESNATTTDVVVKDARYICDYARIYDGSANEQLATNHVVREDGKHYIDSATVGTDYIVDYFTIDLRPEIATIMTNTTYTQTLESDKQGIMVDKLIRIIQQTERLSYHSACLNVMFSIGMACDEGTYDLSIMGDVYANDDTPTTMILPAQTSQFRTERLYLVVP